MNRNKLLISSILALFFTLLQCNGNALRAQDSIHINLNKAIEIALAESPTMRIADRSVDIKREYRKEQIVSLFPDVSLSAAYQRTLLKQSMVMSFGGAQQKIEVGQYNNLNAGASLSLPIIAPALWSSLKLTKMDIELAMEQARSSRLEMINQVKQAFFTYLLAKQSYEVLQRSYSNMELSNQLVTNSYNQGLVSEFEKLRSDVALQNQRPALNSAAKAVNLSQMRLKVLLGLDINEQVIFDGELTDYENDVINANTDITTALDNSTALRQIDLGIKELEQSKKIIRNASMPTLGMSGSFTYTAMGDDGEKFNTFPYSTVGLGLQIPIVSWVSTNYKLKQQNLSIANMRDQRLDTERNLRIAAQSYINDLQQAVEDLASDKETMLQAEKAYSIAKKQYEVGANTWLDLNTAELTLISSQLTYCQAIYNYLTARANLDSLLGLEN